MSLNRQNQVHVSCFGFFFFNFIIIFFLPLLGKFKLMCLLSVSEIVPGSEDIESEIQGWSCLTFSQSPRLPLFYRVLLFVFTVQICYTDVKCSKWSQTKTLNSPAWLTENVYFCKFKVIIYIQYWSNQWQSSLCCPLVDTKRNTY